MADHRHVLSSISLPPIWQAYSPTNAFICGICFAKYMCVLMTMTTYDFKTHNHCRHPCITTMMGAVVGSEPLLVMELMEHGTAST